jgi:multiple antibiotic resistance protein
MDKFWLAFVPLFVAVDALGVLPIFIGFTRGLDPLKVRRIALQSVATGAVVALVFLFTGRPLLSLLGISEADFMVAGGTILFVISASDLVTGGRKFSTEDAENVGAVPLGVPLVVGPAVLTTTLLLADELGAAYTAVALITNMGVTALVLFSAVPIHRILGENGSKVVSKLAHLLLAAIGVMIVRRGLTILLRG